MSQVASGLLDRTFVRESADFTILVRESADDIGNLISQMKITDDPYSLYMLMLHRLKQVLLLVSSNGHITFIEVLISFFWIFFFRVEVRHYNIHVFWDLFQDENGTPNSLKYDIYPYGLVVLMLIVIRRISVELLVIFLF